MRWLDDITHTNDMNMSKLQEIAKDREAWCCSPRGRKELDMTGQLNNNNSNYSEYMSICVCIYIHILIY